MLSSSFRRVVEKALESALPYVVDYIAIILGIGVHETRLWDDEDHTADGEISLYPIQSSIKSVYPDIDIKEIMESAHKYIEKLSDEEYREIPPSQHSRR